MQRELLEIIFNRCVIALRRKGRFDATVVGEDWIAAWKSGFSYNPRGAAEAAAEWNAEVEHAFRLDSLGERVRVKLQPERAWNLDLDDYARIELTDGHINAEWVLKLAPDQHPEKSRALILESRALPDRVTAERAALRIESALALAFVRLGYGFAFAERTPPGVITQAGLALAIPPGAQGLKDKLGVTIFQTPPPAFFVGLGDARASVMVRHTRFVQELERALSDIKDLDERTRTAYDLFASSRFENSSRSRFLLLVMSVEALVERSKRPQAEQDFLDDVIDGLTTSCLPIPNRTTMKQALTYLKSQSISTAAHSMITKAVSLEAAVAFKRMYAIRSRLVHGGQAIDPSTLNDASNQLESIVKSLLVGRMLRSEESQ